MMAELVGTTAAEVEALYCQTKIPLSQIEMDAVQRIALAAQKALIRNVWSARFLGQSWESSIEEMMMQLGEMPYHFPKGTLGCTTEEKTNEGEE